MVNPHFRRLLIVPAVILILWIAGKYLLEPILPFLLAVIPALAAEPLVDTLQKRLHLKRSISSGAGITITLAVTTLVLLAFFAFLVRELESFSSVLPELTGAAVDGMDSLELFLTDLTYKAPEDLQPVLVNGVHGLFSDGSQLLDRFIGGIINLASGFVKALPNGALGLGTWIIASFMLSARLPRIRSWLDAHTPAAWKEQYLPVLKRLKKNILGWLFAQLKLTGITAAILLVSFLLLRIPYAPLWAVLICLVDALPVLGTGTVLIPWSLVCFLQGDTMQALGLLITYAVAFLVRSVLEPRLVGHQLGLDPLVTLMALYAGFRLMGLPGMLLAPLLTVTVTRLFSEEPA